MYHKGIISMQIGGTRLILRQNRSELYPAKAKCRFPACLPCWIFLRNPFEDGIQPGNGPPWTMSCLSGIAR